MPELTEHGFGAKNQNLNTLSNFESMNYFDRIKSDTINLSWSKDQTIWRSIKGIQVIRVCPLNLCITNWYKVI